MVAKSDIEMTEREFDFVQDGETIKYKIVKPNFLIGNQADLKYKKGFIDAISAGLITSFQMKEKLDGIEYYTESSVKLTEIDEKIQEQVDKLDDFETEEEATETILELRSLRAQRLLEVFKVNSMYDNTAESYAENVRNQYYASQLTRDCKGNKVWDSFEKFLEEGNTFLGAEAVNQVMLFNANVKNNFQMEYAENKWMLEHGIMNEEGRYIGKDADKEKEEGEETPEVSAEIEEKPKKKSKKKKKEEAVTS